MKFFLFSFLIFASVFSSRILNNSNVDQDPKVISIDKDIIMSIPQITKDSVDIFIIWGGYYYANNVWMYSNCSSNLKKEKIIICANWFVSLKKIKEKTSFILNKYNMSTESLFGFSAGSFQVYNNYSKKLKYAGLIDPSVANYCLNKDYSNNVIMIYNYRNWDSKSISIQKKLHNKIINSGGIVKSLNLNHANFPKYFFDNYIK